MGGQQSSQASRGDSSDFENHSKIKFEKLPRQMTPHERRMLETLCVGSELSGSAGVRSRSRSVCDPRVLSRDPAHVFSIKRKINGSLDLELDTDTVSSTCDDDDSAPVPPPSPYRRDGFQTGESSEEMKDRKKSISIPKDHRAKESLTRVFNTNLFFNHLDVDERDAISDAMFKETHEAGDVIIKQGDDGDLFYIIDTGEVDVLINDELVSSITEGGSFGELALIHGTPRAATIVAKTSVVLWSIDRDSYRGILMESTINKRKLYEDFLTQLPIFENLYDWERMTIADALEEVTFEDGDIVVKEGDDGDGFFIIVEGEAVVTQVDHESGEIRELSRLKNSDYFGEVSLLLDQPRLATVRAAGQLVCVRLDRARFERLLGPCSEILKRNMNSYNIK